MEAQKLEKKRPIPYIADFSQTGVMTIGWDRPMTPYEKPNEIPPTRVAINMDLMKGPVDSGRSRVLQQEAREEVWFSEIQDLDSRRMMLLDALQVQM